MPAYLQHATIAGAFVKRLPLLNAEVLEELGGVGSLKVDLLASTPGAAALAAAGDGLLDLYVDGQRRFTALLEDDSDDQAQLDGQRVLTVSGRGTLALFDRALIYPPGGAGTLPMERAFTGSPFGFIMRTLLEAAQARGVAGLAGVTLSFTDTHDSAGAAWAKTVTQTFDARAKLLSFILGMVDQGVVDVRMDRLTLHAYNPATVLNTDRPSVIIRRGRELAEAPRTRSRRSVSTAVLVVGEEGANTVRTSATGIAALGRREETYEQSGTTGSVLQIVGDAFLEANARVAEGITVTYPLEAGGPAPWVAFGIGDRIRMDTRRLADGSLEPLRVRSIAASAGPDGWRHRPTLELADLFVEASVRLARKVDALTNGAVTSVTGAPGAIPDVTAPARPATVTVGSVAYDQPDGTFLALATVSWAQVTTNADGTAITDLAGYYVSHRLNGEEWSGETFTQALTLSVEALEPGATFTARVRAVDRTGNSSAHRTSLDYVLERDQAAPTAPGAPTATGGVGIVRATWNGLLGGAAPPADFSHVEVHASTVSGFTPDDTTHRDNLRAAGVSPLLGFPYDQPVYIRLVAVDQSGNRDRSNASPQASATPVRAADGDISSLNVGKLVAGVLVADITVSARIKTADTGQRVEMDSLGLTAYDSTGAATVEIRGSGGTITGGLIRTKATGKRVQIGSSGTAYWVGTYTGGVIADAVSFFPSGTFARPAQVFLTESLFGSTYGTDLHLFSGQAASSGANTPYSAIHVGTGINGTDAVVIETRTGGGAGAIAGNIVVDSSRHLTLFGATGLTIGSADTARHPVNLYDVIEVQLNSANAYGGLKSGGAGGIRGQVEQWEKHRASISWASGSANADYTWTYETAFVTQPVVVAMTDDTVNNNNPNAYCWGRASSAASTIIRAQKTAAVTSATTVTVNLLAVR